MSELKEILSSLSEEIRVRILILLCDSSLRVNCFVIVFNLPQSTISRHLSVLRKGGLVKIARDCTNNYYSINTDEPFKQLKESLIDLYWKELKDVEPFKSDLKKLQELKAECKANCKAHIAHSHLFMEVKK